MTSLGQVQWPGPVTVPSHTHKRKCHNLHALFSKVHCQVHLGDVKFNKPGVYIINAMCKAPCDSVPNFQRGLFRHTSPRKFLV